jgi:hypothetical protein
LVNFVFAYFSFRFFYDSVLTLQAALHHSDASTQYKQPQYASSHETKAAEGQELALLEDMLFGGGNGVTRASSVAPSMDARDIAMRRQAKANEPTKFLKNYDSSDESSDV